jgi:hypothetical protein
MNNPTDRRVRAALNDLAGGPVPANLADRALNAAARQHRRRFAAVAGAAAVVAAVAVAVPLMSRGEAPTLGPQTAVGTPSSEPTTPATSKAVRLLPMADVANTSGQCPEARRADPKVKQVLRADWPDFVAATVAALPKRSDYVMQYGWDWCANPSDPDVSYAYAIISLGPLRERGYLTLNMFANMTGLPATCADVKRLAGKADLPVKVEFCAERSGDGPLAYGLRVQDWVTVAAVYPDGRSISMESYPDAAGKLHVPAEQAHIAVTDPRVHDVFP